VVFRGYRVPRPFVIWASLVMSALAAAAAIYGLQMRLDHLAGLYQQGGTSALWRDCVVIFIQTGLSAFLVAVTYAAFKRPRWGRGICGVFAVLLAIYVVYEAVHPDPHPLFPIEPGAQEVGAWIGRIMMAALVLIYAYKMVLGSRVRAYFSRAVPPSLSGRSGFAPKR
jgi:hypothetical protein